MDTISIAVLGDRIKSDGEPVIKIIIEKDE